MIQIKMLPARAGDCFLLHFDNHVNILIDTGFQATYRTYLKPQLESLRRRGECIDLMVVTHIDGDHIGGAIELLRENKECRCPQIIQIREIWYNACHHARKPWTAINTLTDEQKSDLKKIVSRQQGVPSQMDVVYRKEISSTQGDSLASFLYKWDYTKIWNVHFQGNAVSASVSKPYCLKDIVIHVLSPTNNALHNLFEKWLYDLRKYNSKFPVSDDIIFEQAYEQYVKGLSRDNTCRKEIGANFLNLRDLVNSPLECLRPDRSESNISSIAMLIEYQEKRLLFLADASDRLVLESLEKLYPSSDEFYFDVIKLSHHGSSRNNFSLLEKVKAHKYLFSSDGKRSGHPSLETVAKIIQTNKDNKTLYFNYPLEYMKTFLQCSRLEREYQYCPNFGKEGTEIEV